ncbi:Serine/threonine-protein kinase Sgk3, partial [Coemansia thaxteri]
NRPSVKPAGNSEYSSATLPLASTKQAQPHQQQVTRHMPHVDNSQHALAAYITSVETRESSGSSSGPGELRMAGLRMGRKRFLVYRILVTGSHSAQWWVARRYTEFHELHQLLRRQFPAKAHYWGELFPSKRLIPGLSSSADSVMQRRERLNAFLRTLTQDAEVCRCACMQQFLRDDPLDPDSIPLAERHAAAAQQKPGYGAIQPLQHQRDAGAQPMPTKRSVSSGGALLPRIDHSALYVSPQHPLPLPDSWDRGAGSQATLLHAHPPLPTAPARMRESVERMASMPMLKSAGARPNFDLSAPMPAPPPQSSSG